MAGVRTAAPPRWLAATLLIAAVALGVPLSVPRAQPAAASEPAAASFQAFWSVFRAAVLSGDAAALVGLSRDPIETRGTLDSDPVRASPARDVPALVARVLAEDSGLSTVAHTTNSDFVTATAVVPPLGPGVAIGDDTARIGPFAFRRQAGTWWLFRIYVED